jgi:hypothetical protein
MTKARETETVDYEKKCKDLYACRVAMSKECRQLEKENRGLKRIQDKNFKVLTQISKLIWSIE